MRISSALACAALSLLLPSRAPAQELFDHTVVRDMHFSFHQANWWNDLLNSFNTGQDIRADLLFEGQTYTDVGFRVKGASSSTFVPVKKPFNLTMDSFVPGQDLWGFSTLNLNNGALDPTLTREVLSYEIFRPHLPAPRTAYVRVHLNGTYWGIYILVEQPNSDFLREWFADENGTRYKADRPSGAAVETSTLVWLGSSPSSYQSRYEIKTPSHPNAWTDLIQMIDKLNNEPAATFKQEIERFIDVDRALWYLACNNIVINSDDYGGAGHNYYMYFDPIDGRMSMIPWDLNEAFGTHGPSSNPWNYSELNGSTSSSRPLTRRLLAVPEWRELYLAHYRVLLRNWMDWTGVLEPLNTQLQSLIHADVMADPNYIHTMAQFDPNLPGRFWWNFHYIHGLREVIVNRRSYLLTRPDLTKPEPQISQVAFDPARRTSGQQVWVSARVTGSPAIQSVVLRHSEVGPFRDAQMFDDGQHRDGAAGDGVYGGSFLAGDGGTTMRFYVHATDAAGTVQVEPETAENTFFSIQVAFGQPVGPVAINELLADNQNGDRDQSGEREDWFELYNTGTTPYDLGDHYLTDDTNAPRKWQVPSGTVIPPGGFLRFWADSEPTEGPLHTNFKLSKDGERLALYDVDARGNALLDGVEFGEQKEDRSYGRVPDGGPEFYFVYTPSGAAPLLRPGEYTRYDGRRTGSPTDFDLRAGGNAWAGQTFNLELEGGTPGGAAAIWFAFAPAKLEIPPFGILGIDLVGSFALPIGLDVNGEAFLPIPIPFGAGGAWVFCQALHQDLSNALAVRFGP